MTESVRRPIAQRDRFYAKALTRWLANSKVTPNLISFTSIVFAGLAGLCFYAQGVTNSIGDRVMLLIGAALFCQLRLLANMLDGMVAVEAEKGGPDGPVWNELPDRFADIFILVGAGYGVAVLGLAEPSLGWAAAVAAVMTAYVREVGKGAGAPPDFSGPMAKPHRMFVMTMAALISTLEPLWNWRGELIHYALWLVLIGSIVTTINRTRRALKALKAAKS
ncbi:CDP-alcohol phosphatidyltransferase family protein [Terricaulis sp.]|uniref:CDP-alcohol phosphatidyltransferase family protein n=1 Tax=Terricaulis sp. TaxID=2768686 RepID=UPI0037834A4C